MNYAVILSGGIGSRMRMKGVPKQYIEVDEKPILIYTLEKFEASEKVDSIIIVAASEWQNTILEWINKYSITKFSAFALPGEQRQESILNGLEQCVNDTNNDNDVVIIHDAVRPSLSLDLIANCIDSASEYGGCMPVIHISDTVYQSIDGSSISSLLDRNTLFAGQAPEAFRLLEYYKLNKSVDRDELLSYKGTSEIAHRYGMQVRLIPGEDGNLKITTPADLTRFQTSCEQSKR